MIDFNRWTDIAEAGTAILNPLSEEKLQLLGDVALWRRGLRQLDLGCGKGEMLVQWSVRHGVEGIGIDVYAPLVADAVARARELGVDDRVTFHVADAATYEAAGPFDVVSCIGATWLGGQLAGTLGVMARSLAPGGRLLVGEPFRVSTGGPVVVLDQLELAGFDLVELVVASHDDWDRYMARQWATAAAWLRANPDDDDATGVREWLDRDRRSYLADDRTDMGWGVFVAERRE